MTRRELLFATAATPLAAKAAAARPSLLLFSKHLPVPDYEELAAESKAFGFDGIDLTVRPGGHVLPENVERDLPRAVETIRTHGLTVPMITTGLTSPGDPAAKPTFATAARLRIPFFKFGYWRYDQTPVEEKIASVRRDVAGLLHIARPYDIVGGFHNHSTDFVGAAVWDIREIIGEMDPARVGYYFDPCHATAEGGGYGWELALRMVLPRLKMVALKDFYWEERNGRWRIRWCPLGEGMVNFEKFFRMLAEAQFTGPISLHLEYNPSDEAAAIASDLASMKRMVASAYGA